VTNFIPVGVDSVLNRLMLDEITAKFYERSCPFSEQDILYFSNLAYFGLYEAVEAIETFFNVIEATFFSMFLCMRMQYLSFA